MFTASVSGAASGMLTVCAYVIFFSTLSGTLSCLVRVCGGMEPRLFALLCGFLELSGGISEASGLPDGRQALILTAAIAGWSGCPSTVRSPASVPGGTSRFAPISLPRQCRQSCAARSWR